VFDGIVAGFEGVADALCGAAVSGDLESVVVSGGDNGMHFFKGHAERVVVVGVGCGGITCRIGFYPFDSVLHQFADGSAGFCGTIDEQDEAIHADAAKVGVPVHQSADTANFATAGGQSGA